MGQCQVPLAPEGQRYVAVAGGVYHSVALTDHGLVVPFGCDLTGQCRVPPAPEGRWYVAVAAGTDQSVALLDDGRAVCWGKHPPPSGMIDEPAPRDRGPFVAVAAGGVKAVALTREGQVVQWGRRVYEGQWGGQLAVRHDVPVLPEGLWFGVLGKVALALRLNGTEVVCQYAVTGTEVVGGRLAAPSADDGGDVQLGDWRKALARTLRRPVQSLVLVGPGGKELSTAADDESVLALLRE